MLTNLKQGFENQALASGFPVFLNRRFIVISACVLLSLMMVGSCNNAAQKSETLLSQAMIDFSDFSKGKLIRHAYDLQNAVAENPDSFFRMSARDLTLMLAKPDLERKDYPGVVWQYRSGSCVLDVFYTAADDDALDRAQIQHYEIRNRGVITQAQDEQVASWNCLQSLYHDRQKVIEASFNEIFAQIRGDAS